MKIEIVEAYPIVLAGQNKKKTAFSLHVYIIDFDIDLRGIYAIKYKDSYIIKMPYRNSVDSETKERVSYPVFKFMNQETMNKFLELIKEEVILFFKSKEKDNEH